MARETCRRDLRSPRPAASGGVCARRGRPAACAGAPRVRGVRGAAGHAHPAGRLPARLHAAARARAGRPSGRLPGHLARGDGRDARGRTGADHPGPRWAARSSRCGPPHRRPAQRPGVRRRRGATGSTPSTSGGSSSPARPHSRPTRTSARASSKRLQSAHDSVARARGPAMHRQADSRFHLTDRGAHAAPAHHRVGDRRPVDAARDAQRDPGPRREHRALRHPARADRQRDPRRPRRSRATR